MKLIRFGSPNQELPGVILLSGQRIDVSSFGQDYNEAFFSDGGVALLEKWLKDNANRCSVVDPAVRLGPCIARPSKIICIGLNYARHAAESNMAVPSEPVIFFKATSALCG